MNESHYLHAYVMRKKNKKFTLINKSVRKITISLMKNCRNQSKIQAK